MCLALPGRIVEIGADRAGLFRTGKVDFDGLVKTVDLTCVPQAAVGDYVMVHAGLAISIVDEAEALSVFSYLKEVELAAGTEAEAEAEAEAEENAPS
ncbi:MAG TPA: HypC/HybG/HupF family hydrogenase formation chaperone [Firmicutes bacterium]|nr:HypC/HybG/HupF family hydrogenase formation chaperone [Bacillota bacterium]